MSLPSPDPNLLDPNLPNPDLDPNLPVPNIEAMPDIVNIPARGLSNKATETVDDNVEMNASAVNPETDREVLEPGTTVRESAPDPSPDLNPDPGLDPGSDLNSDPKVDLEPEPKITLFPKRRRSGNSIHMVPSSKRQRVVSASEGSPCLVDPASVAPFPSNTFVSLIDPFLKPDSSILQLGCRDGKIALMLADYIKPHGSVIGVNVPGEGITKAEYNAALLHRRDDSSDSSDSDDMNVKFVRVLDLTRLPFENDRFDIVYACDIMAHLPARKDNKFIVEVLLEMKRVTKPGGYMASRDIAAYHFFPTFDLENLITSSLFRATGLDEWCGPNMPYFYQSIGFRLPGIHVDATTCTRGNAVGERGWAAAYAKCFAKGTKARARWVAAGVSEAKIDLIIMKLMEWGRTEHS